MIPEELAAIKADADLNLYDYAQRLRMGADGGADPVHPEAVPVIAEALVRRVNRWQPSKWPAKRIADDALRAFVIAALREAKAVPVKIAACTGCEGERFEGFICDECDATADGRGGMWLDLEHDAIVTYRADDIVIDIRHATAQRLAKERNK